MCVCLSLIIEVQKRIAWQASDSSSDYGSVIVNENIVAAIKSRAKGFKTFKIVEEDKENLLYLAINVKQANFMILK